MHVHKNECIMAESSTGSLYNFEKLRGRENYIDWRFQMKNFLMHDDLWKCISGYAEGDTTSVEVRGRRDERAICKINLMVEKSVFPYVMQATTAAEA